MKLHLVTGQQQRDEFVAWLIVGEHKRPWLGLDTETTGLRWDDTLRMVQFGDEEDGWSLPFDVCSDLIRDVLTDYQGPIVLHHAKFDARFLERAGLDVSKLWHDTKIMAHLLDASGSTALKELGVRYLSMDSDRLQKELRDAMRKGKFTWATVPLSLTAYWQYAAFDAVLTARLARRLYPDVVAQFAALYETECRVAQFMREAEARGFHLDKDYAADQAVRLDVEITEVTKRWPEINLGSSQQVAAALVEQGISVPTTPKGNPSVTETVLEQIDLPLAADVLAVRRKSKLKSTYFDAFLDLADDAGYLHPIVNTMGARTGRMSCEQPNLQNVPRGSFVRPSLISSEGSILVMADYSQIEYRLLACFANEPRMIEAFLEGKDFHAETARIILGHDPSSDERSTFKNVNFAQIYEAGPDKLAAMSGAPVSEVREFVKVYDQKFPMVKRFKKAMLQYTRANGMAVYTTYGRRCPVDTDRIYAGVNYMVQGTAADVLKEAIVRVADSEWARYFVLPVHDELIFDVPEDKAEALKAALPGLMEVHDRFPVPLTVEVKGQHRWGLAEEVVAGDEGASDPH